MNDVSVYIPFSKRNDDEHIVEGFATTESMDTQGEIVKSEAVEKALPDYMKYANIREMHQWSAVGKTITASLDKSKKGLYISAKIVDPVAWAKCKEGVYTAFSIGGRVLKRVGNVIQEMVLNEISVVDRPANPEAAFTLVKFDGGMTKSPDGVEGVAMEDEVKYPGIKIANQLVSTATQLTYLIEECSGLKRPTKHLEKIVQAMKAAALFELQFDKVEHDKKEAEETGEMLAKVNELRGLLSGALAKNDRNIERSWNKEYFDNLQKVL